MAKDPTAEDKDKVLGIAMVRISISEIIILEFSKPVLRPRENVSRISSFSVDRIILLTL